MKLHRPKNIMPYFDSLREFEDEVIPFAPMTYLTKKINFGDGVELLIGYTISGDAVLVKNNSIKDIKNSEKVDAYKVSKQGIEEYYKKTDRPENSKSIFRKPDVGDTLLCVSKRYVGCTFGELYTVKEIKGGRLAFEIESEYTYEDEYFIIVDTTNEFSGSVIIGHSHRDMTARTINGTSVYTGNPCGEVNLEDNPGKYMDFESLLDEDEVKQRTIKGAEGIIRRPRLDDEDIVQRKYLVPNKIQRSK